MRLLGVYAHPDDETFCIGGTLARYIASGAEAMVATFTQGEAGQIRDASKATRRTLGKVRAQELEEACAALGVQQVRCFDYGDGKLHDIPQETLVEHIVGLIREFKPDVVFTFDETGAYGHPDHIAISQAATTACWLAGDTAAFPHQFSPTNAPHTPDRLYHSCFPRSGRLLLELIVSWLDGLDEKFRGSEEFIHGLMLFADESTMLGFASDHIKLEWYPSGFYIIEQGEPATSLYLVLSGLVNILQEDDGGELTHITSLGPGNFLGEMGLAYGRPRNAHVVVEKNTTCLVFSPGEPTKFAGRGEEADHTVDSLFSPGKQNKATTCIDVTDFIEQKVQALCCHRTQYFISADMFPRNILDAMLGKEYFTHIEPPKEMEITLLPQENTHFHWSNARSQ